MQANKNTGPNQYRHFCLFSGDIFLTFKTTKQPYSIRKSVRVTISLEGKLIKAVLHADRTTIRIIHIPSAQTKV